MKPWIVAHPAMPARADAEPTSAVAPMSRAKSPSGAREAAVAGLSSPPGTCPMTRSTGASTRTAGSTVSAGAA